MMRFFGSLWERLPMQQIGTIVAVAAVVGLLGVQIGGFSRAATGRANIQIHLPTGEYWT